MAKWTLAERAETLESEWEQRAAMRRLKGSNRTKEIQTEIITQIKAAKQKS